MTTNNFVSELDNIFMEWQQKMKTTGDAYYDENGELAFTKDGVIYKNGEKTEITEQKWVNSSKRILFLLKDQHQIRDEGKPFWPEDIRYWLKDAEGDNYDAKQNKEKNRNLVPRFIKNLAYLFWGLSKTTSDEDCAWWYNEVTMHLEKVKEFFNTQPFALIECKKQPGDGKLDDSELKRHLTKYENLLRQEIKILDPNMIVCTSQHIYDFVLKMYSHEELVEIKGHNSIKFHYPSGALVFCSYHPSAPYLSDDKIYEGVMDHYRAFLKSIYNL